MARSNHQGGEQSKTGQKHETEHEPAPSARRVKTEKQQTLEESLNNDKSPENEKADNIASEQVDKPEARKQSAVRPGQEPDVPPNIQEKGIIYFFIRGRVNIDDPKTVDDVARTFILLRPIEKDAKLGDGPIGDARNNRLLALPKKKLPRSGKDRFMIFVEKSNASFKNLKKSFLAGADYETKTAGTRHTPAATPVGEGVYALTSTGRESHLVYMLTIPEKLDSAQKDLGIKEKGSFIISTKNPNYGGPASARLPENPKFPKKVIDEFRSLRWLPSKPIHLDYPNAQLLLVGESSGIEKALEPQEKDDENGAQKPEEFIESLAEEDLQRMRHLTGQQSESIYADLQAQAEGYPRLKTTF
ncbi:unnamed protein product [Clonostachys rosea f. rosea IK726]|uniref:Uncharacterized protein n=2 Tax=Bionectria ochroleuca TaxID=29856 RepID=A0A0B7K971_BIOOC|nr:unnamed protein product [Clonostachys rosea f. rosea IK726]